MNAPPGRATDGCSPPRPEQNAHGLNPGIVCIPEIAGNYRLLHRKLLCACREEGNQMSPTADDRIRAEGAAALIEERLTSLVADPPAVRTSPPTMAREWLDDLLGHADTYRDAALAILAFPVAAEKLLDVRLAPPSRRGVTQRLARKLDLSRAGGSSRRRFVPSASGLGWVSQPGR